ncbi:hypothetical protein FHX09_000460 [Rhizobium sp. BK538]|nr:hypothetical protein [Rhizobium sp. BK538]
MLTRDAAGLVSAICRKLDGVALAIELAAGRVEALGLRQTAELLDQHLSLSWPGRRSAPGRQRTLQATLDWSYDLLSAMERVILRCVAVFSGHFTLDGAIGVAPREIAAGLVIEALENLVAKSMVASRQLNGATRYRLLATTRAYVLALEGDPVAGRNLSRRHAEYCIGWLENKALAGVALRETSARARYLDSLNDVRSALEWCFGESGDQPSGIRLAARAAPIFLGLSLLGDCYKWCGTAIRALGTQESGSPDEMHLQAAFGLSVMFTRGSNDDAREALNRSLAIAGRGEDDHLSLVSDQGGSFHRDLHERTFGLGAGTRYWEPDRRPRAIHDQPLEVLGIASGRRGAARPDRRSPGAGGVERAARQVSSRPNGGREEDHDGRR